MKISLVLSTSRHRNLINFNQFGYHLPNYICKTNKYYGFGLHCKRLQHLESNVPHNNNNNNNYYYFIFIFIFFIGSNVPKAPKAIVKVVECNLYVRVIFSYLAQLLGQLGDVYDIHQYMILEESLDRCMHTHLLTSVANL